MAPAAWTLSRIAGAMRRGWAPRMGSFTLALLEALPSARLAPDRARTVVELFDRSVDERYGLHAQILATKRDPADVIKWMLAALTAQTALLVGGVKLL